MTNDRDTLIPGISMISDKPHLGDLLFKKYRKRISIGFDDLEKFELIDQLEKPVLNFVFTGNKRLILEIYDLMVQFPYSFYMKE